MASGATAYTNSSVNATGQSVTAVPTKLCGALLSNTNTTTTCWVKLYNKATAATVGTDTPLVVIPVIFNSNVQEVFFGNASGATSEDAGVLFSAGLSVGCTTNYLNSDTSAPVAGSMGVTLLYKVIG